MLYTCIHVLSVVYIFLWEKSRNWESIWCVPFLSIFSTEIQSKWIINKNLVHIWTHVLPYNPIYYGGCKMQFEKWEGRNAVKKYFSNWTRRVKAKRKYDDIISHIAHTENHNSKHQNAELFFWPAIPVPVQEMYTKCILHLLRFTKKKSFWKFLTLFLFPLSSSSMGR